MSRMRNRHKLISEPEIKMALIKAVPVVIAVIPSGIDLIPVSINLYRVPSMRILGVSGFDVFNACLGKQLAICGFIGLACAKTSGKCAFRAAPLQRGVIFHPANKPIMQPDGFSIFRSVSFLFALSHRFGNYLID